MMYVWLVAHATMPGGAMDTTLLPLACVAGCSGHSQDSKTVFGHNKYLTYVYYT